MIKRNEAELLGHNSEVRRAIEALTDGKPGADPLYAEENVPACLNDSAADEPDSASDTVSAQSAHNAGANISAFALLAYRTRRFVSHAILAPVVARTMGKHGRIASPARVARRISRALLAAVVFGVSVFVVLVLLAIVSHSESASAKTTRQARQPNVPHANSTTASLPTYREHKGAEADATPRPPAAVARSPKAIATSAFPRPTAPSSAVPVPPTRQAEPDSDSRLW